MPIQVARVAAVRLFAYPEDWPTTRDFYANTLGMHLVLSDDERGVALFHLGDVHVIVERVRRGDPESAGLVGRHLSVSFEVKNAERAWRALKTECPKPPNLPRGNTGAELCSG